MDCCFEIESVKFELFFFSVLPNYHIPNYKIDSRKIGSQIKFSSRSVFILALLKLLVWYGIYKFGSGPKPFPSLFEMTL